MNKTLEEGAMLLAEISRLGTRDLEALLPHIRDLRGRIRMREFDLDTPSTAVSRAAEALATAHLSEAELADYTTRRRVAETVRDDKLTCLDCGKETESLILHVTKGHQITWDEYLTKWGLHDLGARFDDLDDYPRTSISFKEKQSHNAKKAVARYPLSFTGKELKLYRKKQNAKKKVSASGG